MPAPGPAQSGKTDSYTSGSQAAAWCLPSLLVTMRLLQSMTKGSISARVWTQAAVEPSQSFALEDGQLALDRELLGVVDNSVSRAANSPQLTSEGGRLTLWCNPNSARQPLIVRGLGFDNLESNLGDGDSRWSVLPARISNVGRLVSSAHSAAALLSTLRKGESEFSHYLFTLPHVEEPPSDARLSLEPPAIIILGDAAIELFQQASPAGRAAPPSARVWRLQLDDCLSQIEDPASLAEFARSRQSSQVQLPGADGPESFEQARLSAARVLRRSAQPWLFVPALTLDETPRLALLYKTSFDADPYAPQGLIVSGADPSSLPAELVQHLGERDTVTIGLPTEAPPSTRFSVTERPVLSTFGAISTSSPEFASELRQLSLLTSSTTSVLFLGESGVGKRTLARELYRQSDRSGQPLVSLACPDMSADELNAALQNAQAGTLLFEEIGQTPLDMQRLALRQLRGDHSDIRFLATSSGNLATQIRDGSFEPELYARIADLSIDVPPLRDRREDIPLLSRQLVGELAPGRALSASALQAFMRYSFPENVSELRRVLEQGLALHDGEKLDHRAFSFGTSQTYRPPASMVPGGQRHN